MYGDKIKMIRELRSFSQDHMANKLSIGRTPIPVSRKIKQSLPLNYLIKLQKN